MNPTVPDYQVLLTLVIGGLAAGPAANYGTWMPAFDAYNVPSEVPVAFRFIVQGREDTTTMGVILLIFALAVTIIAYKSSLSQLVTEIQVGRQFLAEKQG